MSDIDKIRERIRKLLALADNNPSPEEAAAAATKAAELALEYDLELEKIRESKGEKPLPPSWFYLDDEEHSEAADWLGQLANSICEANGCRFLFVICGHGANRTYRLAGAGRKEVHDIVRLTYTYITESMRRTQRQYIMKANLGSAKLRKHYRYSYRIGYSLAVGKRITAWADALKAQATKNALVLYQGNQLAEVDQFLKDTNAIKSTIEHKQKPVVLDAYDMGTRDGQQVAVNRQMEAARQPERKQIA